VITIRREAKSYRRAIGFGASAVVLVLALFSCSRASAGEGEGLDPGRPHFLQSVHPAGGWHPDSGGLFHWWNPHCFPRCGAPDDYCRKPPPALCWPHYPSFYVWVPADHGHP
jgi:hypothetical protein